MKIKLSRMHQEDRLIAQAGISARKAGKARSDNPYGNPFRKGGPVSDTTHKATWWDLGYTGAIDEQ